MNGGHGGGRLLLCDGEILLGGAAYHPARHPSMYNNQYGQIISHPAGHFNAYPEPEPSFQIKSQNLEKCSNRLIFHTFWQVILPHI